MRLLFSVAALILPAAFFTWGLTFGAGGPSGLRDGRAHTMERPDARLQIDRLVAEGDDDDDDDFSGFAEFFVDNPLTDPETIVSGAALERLTWQSDDPAFVGDLPGSLTALYDSSLPAGLFGFPLGHTFDEDDTFTTAALFVIESDGFVADPFGFFQISWGMWNRDVTGLNRTGNFESFASDAFELLEFNWFPAVSPDFGGPFLGPSVFGVDDGGGDAFANAGYLFGLQLALPFDTPLVALMQHRPADDAVYVQLFAIDGAGRAIPLNGGVGVVPLSFMSDRNYELNTVGPTLWTDGFGGANPAVVARLRFHAIVVAPGIVSEPGALLP